MPVVDALKAGASQVIVLHHLADYGAMSDALLPALPGVVRWLYEYGRMAVAVFLVVGGFLAARALAPDGHAPRTAPWAGIGRRYVRLVVPFAAALAFALVAAAVARQVLVDEFVPPAPTAGRVAAHLLFVQSILGLRTLTAGAWYVAIDFQLFALFSVLLWGARRLRLPAPLPVAVLAAAGMFFFNRHPEWDCWSVYFFGAYGLGALSWWASARTRAWAWLPVLAAVTSAALAVEFRHRLLVALCTALLLGVTRRAGVDGGAWLGPRAGAAVEWLGRISYAVFLVHFPVCLLANALFTHLHLQSPLAGGAGIGLAWALSLGLGAAFHHAVEVPASRLRFDALLALAVERAAWAAALLGLLPSNVEEP
jgi:peptidoglycan/LPS O-acetylase OafA/YrhL